MDPTRFRRPPKWWGPKLCPLCVRLWRPLRLRYQRRGQRLVEIDVRGLEHLRGALHDGNGVLITPNHSAHADALVLLEAAHQLGTPFYFMTAWQVIGMAWWGRRLVLRHHGCFSVHREGTDLTAFKQAVEILESKPNPLVIFPEGEVYHLNERITPFREGPATIALSAAKKAKRPIVCVPCGVRYFYVEDPTPQLLDVMSRLELSVHWRPRPDLPLPERIYRFAEGMLALKELEYLDHTQTGPLPERVRGLSDAVLQRIESCYGIGGGGTIPERVKACRHQVIEQREKLAEDATPEHRRCDEQLEDLFLVVQLFSYPGDYVAERPTVERLAETLDKFEEDVLAKSTAHIRGARRAVVTFGEAIPAQATGRRREAGAELTAALESSVQRLLDSATES